MELKKAPANDSGGLPETPLSFVSFYDAVAISVLVATPRLVVISSL